MELTSPVVAYRTWRVYDRASPTEPGLYPLLAGGRWTPGENVARCSPIWEKQEGVRSRHESPHEDCTCGLHGMPRSPGYDWSLLIVLTSRAYVSGAIVMWGHLRSGGKVIRSSHAQVVALRGENGVDGLVAEMYGVPIVDSDEHLRYCATEYGDELTDQQLKELASAES